MTIVTMRTDEKMHPFTRLIALPEPIADGSTDLAEVLSLWQAARRRQETFRTEPALSKAEGVAFTLDRLAMMLRAGDGAEQAICCVAGRDGSLFVIKIRQVVDDLNSGRRTLVEALQTVAGQGAGQVSHQGVPGVHRSGSPSRVLRITFLIAPAAISGAYCLNSPRCGGRQLQICTLLGQ